MKKRIWMNWQELDRLRDLFRRELADGGDNAEIPFDHVLGLLEKPEVTRILRSRTARNAFAQWGLQVGVRHHLRVYQVQVVNPERWRSATKGILADQASPAPPALSDEDDHDDETDALVPPADPDYLMPAWADDLKLSISAGEKILLSGPTGAGKTSIIKELAARLGQKLIRVNLNGQSGPCDIIGGWKIQGKEMVFQHGPIPQAMRLGAWLVLDELDAALPQTLFALQSIMEERGELSIPETGERLAPHPDFRVLATCNTLGRGDESGLYAGTNVLNAALLDRFQSVYLCDYLTPPEELTLLLKKAPGLDQRTAERMVRVAADLRQALEDGVVCSPFSTRMQIAWARKTAQLRHAGRAARYVILNRLSPEERRVVGEVLQRHGF